MGVHPSKKDESAALQTHNTYERRSHNASEHATTAGTVTVTAAPAATAVVRPEAATARSDSRGHVAPSSAAAHAASSPQPPTAATSNVTLSVELPQSPDSGSGAVAASPSDFTAALPRSDTHGNLSKLLSQRRTSASNRRCSGAAASTDASAAASPAQSRRCSVVGLRPEDRVSSAAVLQWQRDTQARAEAHSAASSPAAAAAAAASASNSEGRKRSVSSSSAQASSSRSGSPPIRYGIHASNSLHPSMSFSNLSSFGGVYDSPESSQRSSHRLHVSTLLAHCANCGRLHRGEVLVLLKDGGHIHCSKECYWSSRLQRGNFDDHAEEEGAECTEIESECDSASAGACDGAESASASFSPRGRVIIDDGHEERCNDEELLDELDCKKRQIELTLGADLEAASNSEIPTSSNIRRVSNSRSNNNAPAAAAAAESHAQLPRGRGHRSHS